MLRAVADTHAVIWYLYDDARLSEIARATIEAAAAVVASMPLIDRLQVPDLPDRIIAATAQHHNVPVISRDRRIRLAGLPTIW